jgi:hypothetical protein
MLNRRIDNFQIFKYTIYCLLACNAYLFFREDHAASSRIFINGVSWSTLVQGYSASIDTMSWLLLLLVFELETYVIPEHQLKSGLKASLNSIKMVSYLCILYSFYGYIMKYTLVHDTSPLNIDPCTLVKTSYTYIVNLDEYVPITNEQCQILAQSPFYQINKTQVISSYSTLMVAQRQVFVDVLTSADWLLIVLIIDIDVYLQFKGRLTQRWTQISAVIKVLLYSILLINLIYWGIEGTLLSFWDALLWLIAFVFIELNILGFQENNERQTESECTTSIKDISVR